MSDCTPLRYVPLRLLHFVLRTKVLVTQRSIHSSDGLLLARKANMPQWRSNFNPEHIYFVTTKAVDYAHVFQREVIKRLLLDTLDCMRAQKRIKLFSFVIMPNHIHVIVQCSVQDPLSDVLRDYKKQTADRLIRQLKAERNQKALDFFASKVERLAKQHYKIWEDDYNAKDVVTADFLQQKIVYIHNNPCQPHWNLSATPEEYVWSSARFYLTDEPSIIPIEDARKIWG